MSYLCPKCNKPNNIDRSNVEYPSTDYKTCKHCGTMVEIELDIVIKEEIRTKVVDFNNK